MTEKFQNKYRIPSARLPGYDYRNEGSYFITICTHNRGRYFGDCQHGMMCLSPIGLIAKQFWLDIPNHFPNTALGAFVVMPDHIHGILNIDKKWNEPFVETHHDASQNSHEVPPNTHDTFPNVHPDLLSETHHDASLQSVNEYFRKLSAPAKSVSTMIRLYKSAVTVESRKWNPEFAWQSRFHDHIIRDHFEYEGITHYIRQNPVNWENNYL